MQRRYWIPLVLLLVAGSLLALGYCINEDTIPLTESAVDDVASSASTVKQDKNHPDFKSAGIISAYDRCLKTRAQMNKVEPGKGDEFFKCEELNSYMEPAERLKAAWRQGLVEKCEQAIKAFLWDPKSYRFVDRLYIATENNGIDVRLTYSESDGFGGRMQEHRTCSYKL